MSEMRLHSPTGQRLYLNEAERAAFLHRASQESAEVRTFCETLHYTGCRLSEALELTACQIDLEGGQVTFRSLKKRRDDVFRAVPVPAGYLDVMKMGHRLTGGRRGRAKPDELLWDWGRQHAWKLVKGVMVAAGVASGAHQTPKGLRHAFGIHAVVSGVPLNMVSKWMGHADIATTAIYATAIGKEEREIASRMWVQ